jgi:branched-subunit amino acid aminotransferase/4-amino-4-deoxychorismate lyase
MERNGVGNDGTDAYIRITISRGTGDIGLDPALCPTPTVVIMTQTTQAPSPRALSDRREPNRGPHETKPLERARSADQSHQFS